MILDLTPRQISLLQDLIFDEIDRVGGYDNLLDEIEDILEQIRVNKAKYGNE
jgi:hypothetical protein